MTRREGDPTDARSPLPSSRAFVVQFTLAADPIQGPVEGRIEHVDSGCSRRFASLDELLAFVTETFAAR